MMPNLQTVLIDNIITKLKIQEKPPADAGGCKVHDRSRPVPANREPSTLRVYAAASQRNLYTGYALFLASPSVGSTPVFCA